MTALERPLAQRWPRETQGTILKHMKALSISWYAFNNGQPCSLSLQITLLGTCLQRQECSHILSVDLRAHLSRAEDEALEAFFFWRVGMAVRGTLVHDQPLEAHTLDALHVPGNIYPKDYAKTQYFESHRATPCGGYIIKNLPSVCYPVFLDTAQGAIRIQFQEACTWLRCMQKGQYRSTSTQFQMHHALQPDPKTSPHLSLSSSPPF